MRETSRLDELLREAPLLLTEGSVYERLRRHPHMPFDRELAHASLVYDRAARENLEATHREYLDIARRRRVPMLALTDTWRASAERVARSRFRGLPVNADNAAFLLEVRDAARAEGAEVLVGGNLGPRGDAYRPEEAPQAELAETLARPQVEELASARVDFLQASTLPSAREALGVARAMARTSAPYLLSFVVRRTGRLLDGTPLAEAIAAIDDGVTRPPTAYLVNCVHPSVLLDALEERSVGERLAGLQANTSRLSPEELDGREELDTDEPASFGRAMAALGRRFGLRVLGGCCGTDARHIEAIASAA